MCAKDMTRGGETRTCLAGILGRRGTPGDAEARHIVSRGLLCKDWVLYKQQRLDDDGFMIVDKDVGNPRAINNEERAWNTECRAVAASVCR